MGAAHLLLFFAPLVLFVQQSSGQPQKMPAEWDSRQANQFPKPLLNDSKCQVPSPMRICDPNTVLPTRSREESNELLKKIEGLEISGDSSDKKCLCNKDCPQPTVMMIVALMKCLNKEVHDQWVETKEIAQIFREQWKLDDCSVVLVSASDNNKYNLNPGKAVVELLTSNVTDGINNIVNETFMKGQLADGIKRTVSLYSEALNETTKTPPPVTETPAPPSDETVTAIVIIIVVIIAVAIVVLIVFVAIKCKRKKQAQIQKDKEKESSKREETETKPLNV